MFDARHALADDYGLRSNEYTEKGELKNDWMKQAFYDGESPQHIYT
jgi:hypothetical protein